MQQNKQKNAPVRLKEGQIIYVTIKRLGINGEGIGYYKRKIVFIPQALPNEFVKAKITEAKKNYAKATLLQVKKASPDRIEKRDPYDVGGIELEHLAYPAQLEFKRDVIKQALEKFKPAGFKKMDLKATLGMDDPYHYRNKAAFQVKKAKSGQLIAGLYKPESHFLVDLPTFATQGNLTMKVIRTTLKLLEKWHIPAYDEHKNQGVIRTLVVRESFAAKQAQLVLVTHEKRIPHVMDLVFDIHNALPEVVSIMQNYHPEKSSLIFGEETHNLFGQDYIVESLGNVSFELSARAFFQMNPKQTKVMYDEVKKALALDHNDTLVDAYCGVGTIGLYCGQEAKEILGMDVIPEAIADARNNARKSQIDNAQYEVGDAKKVFAKWKKAGKSFNALVVDPPRTGLDDETIKQILAEEPAKFVYVSCNPSTLARDLCLLTQKYHVEYIQPIDMFPQTARTEAVVKLKLK